MDGNAKSLQARGMNKMFIPYRCESCIHGEWLQQDSTWDCMLDCSDDEECERNYEDDERV